MVRAPCCEKVGLKRGRWTAEEDEILIKYIQQKGEGSWRTLPKNAGLLRCGKSCRLRWINYLRSDLKRGNFTSEEEETIIELHRSVGNRWSLIASQLPGRTDNEVKNYWNSHLSRRIYSFGSGKNNGSLLRTSAIDSIKMANASKRRGGRVSRSVAKKYKKNYTHSTSSMPRPKKPAETSQDNFTATGKACRAAGQTEELQGLNGTVKVNEDKDNDVGLSEDTMTKHIYEETEWWGCIDCMNDQSCINGQSQFPSSFSPTPKHLEEETTLVVGPLGGQDHSFVTTALLDQDFLCEPSGSMEIPELCKEGMNESMAQDCTLDGKDGSCDLYPDATNLSNRLSPMNSQFNNEELPYNEWEFDAAAYGCSLWDEDNDILLWV